MMQDIVSTQQNCLESCRTLKESLFTRQELTAEITKAEKAKADIAAGKAAKEAAVLHESAMAAQMEQAMTEEATDESGDELSRSRTASTGSRGRTASLSGMKPRRNSSIFIRLPDNMGTSLIRKSADVLPNSQLLNALSTGEEPEEAAVAPDSLSPAENRKPAVSFLEESVDYGLEDIDVSKMVAANESIYVEPIDTSKVALFEHFIVVGASEEVCCTYMLYSI